MFSSVAPIYQQALNTARYSNNKTKVLSVKLGKTLGLTKVPITDSEESTQVRKKLVDHQGGLKLRALVH